MRRRHELSRFLEWLLGNKTQSQVAQGVDPRSFRRSTHWCWNITPAIEVTGEIYPEVQLDGIYLGSWCCLIAIAGEHVIGYQWCDTEKRVAWEQLLTRFPAPDLVVIDGGSGLASALKHCWPETPVQRCLVHIQRNVRVLITMRPRTTAGRELRAISLALTRITSQDQARAWLLALNQWHGKHHQMLNEKTYRSHHRGSLPQSVRPHQRWWFTHDRLRKAYQLLERASQQEVLFTYLKDEHRSRNASSTTNRIEGGINAQLRNLLRNHRGLTPEHAKRAVEWFLYKHSQNPAPAHQLIKKEHYEPVAYTQEIEEHIGPAELGTGLNANEGLWHRKGWAGRAS
ncbi:IS1249 family transposase [Neomicrococcus lactis]|uniref:Mutator family transposase n=1 Tax=Neomicrococcus lactis TaxID=732241 RepID=A0A7W8YAT6_9MICC|nr:hypothetical protein [Neomicrococcus lactis]MBB5597261.1 hypothetical protein [Neomicrococcus lactis]MBB5597483.1 hypothetical protein [Neomicrococcus lactis]MBB5598138.1 hypothetical protein [Neomicrococcus lactis]MBB5598475.1 hypothetical protein [Neomicrococcus lactis]